MEITHQVPSLHICGHSKKILPDLADIGFNNFSLDNCENLEEIKNLIGDRMLLGGNIAPVDVMMNGSIDDVIEATRQVIYYGSDSPCGYIVMPGCQVPRGTPLENIDALRYAVRKYSKGAVKVSESTRSRNRQIKSPTVSERNRKKSQLAASECKQTYPLPAVSKYRKTGVE